MPNEASAIVVANKFSQDQAQVLLVDRNQVIQTLAPDGPDEPFAIGVGFGSADRRSDRSRTKILQRCVE